MASQFNVLDYARQLEATGVAKDQAEVHARALTTVLSEVAFARDVAQLEDNLRKEIRQSVEMLRTDLTAKIDGLKFAVNARIDQLEAELRAEITAVRAEIAAVRSEMHSLAHELALHRWVLGLGIALNTATLALVFKILIP